MSALAVIESAATGVFSVGATWTGGVAPGTGDQAVILDTHIVTLGADRTIGALKISIGGTIVGAGFKLTLDGSVDAVAVYDNDGTVSGVLDITITGGSVPRQIDATASGNIRNLVINASGLTFTLVTAMTLDGTYTLTAGTLDQGSFAMTVAGATSITGTHTPNAGTFTATGAVTVNSGGILGSATAWTFAPATTVTIALGGTLTTTATFTMPAATFTANGAVNIGSATLVSGGTLAIGTGAMVATGTLTITGTLTWTNTGTLDVDALIISVTTGALNSTSTIPITCTVRTAFTNNRNTNYVVSMSGTVGNGSVWTFGTASQSATITNNGVIHNGVTSTGATVLLTLKAASSAFPWTWAGTAPVTDDNGGSNKHWIFRDGIMTPAITTGAGQNDAFIALSCVFIGAVTISAGDTWRSISSTYRAGITGDVISVSHNGIWGRVAYGATTAFSTINDTAYIPKPGGSIQVLAGTLTADRGHFNETKPAAASAAFLELVLSDLIVPTGTTFVSDDKVRIRLPPEWSTFKHAGTITFGALKAYTDCPAGLVTPPGNPEQNRMLPKVAA